VRTETKIAAGASGTEMGAMFFVQGIIGVIQREVQRKKETEAPAKKDDESVMESQKCETVMNSSAKK